VSHPNAIPNPAFTDQQIDETAAYLATLRPAKWRRAAAPRPASFPGADSIFSSACGPLPSRPASFACHKWN